MVKPVRNSLMIIMHAVVLQGCGLADEGSQRLSVFNSYYSALQSGSDQKWDFTSDTVKVWFDDRGGKPVLQVKGVKAGGMWKEWDEVMNSRSHYDSLWYDEEERTVRGFFYENNDFYELIGKSPNKTLRTYWFDDADRINEILIYWLLEENTTTGQHLKPIVEWAQAHDSAEIARLYPEGRLVPSAENAERWKILLKKYRQATDSL